jgi:uncharacterized membrane protein
MIYVAAYIAAVVTFFAIDTLWIGWMASDFYNEQIGHLLGDKVNVPAAALFYLMYIAGIIVFAVKPAILADSIRTASIYGALFGFFCYATYDFTNYATLRDWPLTMVVVDIFWGVLLTCTVATVAAWIAFKFR